MYKQLGGVHRDAGEAPGRGGSEQARLPGAAGACFCKENVRKQKNIIITIIISISKNKKTSEKENTQKAKQIVTINNKILKTIQIYIIIK